MKFAVIRHTFVLTQIQENPPESEGSWEHFVWLFDDERDSIAFAITLLDSPLLKNEFAMADAVEQLEKRRYYQIGGESVAVGVVMNMVEKFGLTREEDSPDWEESAKEFVSNEKRKNNLH